MLNLDLNLMSNIYKQASRIGLRIGNYSVEQLWTLPLSSKSPTAACLNNLAVAVYNELKGTSEISFVSSSPNSKDRALNELRLELLKDIIHTRQEEAKTDANIAATQSTIKVLEDAARASREKELLELPTDQLEAKIRELRQKVAENTQPTLR